MSLLSRQRGAVERGVGGDGCALTASLLLLRNSFFAKCRRLRGSHFLCEQVPRASAPGLGCFALSGAGVSWHKHSRVTEYHLNIFG
jgi:hypothetical protein